MNKKGFTLIELIMVIIIIGIIGMMTIPGIMKSLTESRKNSGENVEKILKSNLEMYNIDNEVDLWCNLDDYRDDKGELIQNSLPTDCDFSQDVKLGITFEELSESNQDIDLGECLLNKSVSAKGINGDNGNFAFVITRKQGEKAIYTYEAHIVCSKDFKKGNHSVDEKGIYLDSFNNTYTSYYES